jgi:hypothetical protein
MEAILRLQTFLRSSPVARDILFVCVFIGICAIYEKAGAYFRTRRAFEQGSVFYQARKFTTERIGRKQLFFRMAYDAVRYPTLVALCAAAGVIPVIFAGAWLIDEITSTFLSHSPLVCDNVEFFSTLWQVQAFHLIDHSARFSG